MMTRYEQMTKGNGLDGYSNFAGDDTEIRDFLCGPARHRDSDDFQESNFHVALKMLGGESDTVQVHRFGHWAVGWIEQIYVRPDTPAVKILEEIETSLEDYPVLDDEDFSNRETDHADTIWRDCYDVKDRVAYIRKHENEFEFRGYADMIGCVRGKYFAGYASELIS